MRQGRVGQEISRDGKGFMGKRQFSCEVGRTSHKQDGSIREGERDEGQGFGSKERA